MIKDIFIPSKLGSYYISHKRVVSFKITTISVHATLFSFVGKKITIENTITVILQDQTQATLIAAIKKIGSTIGTYDEVVTSLISSAVICKELVLPFIGREKIKMILGYEIEPLLPFTLDEAVIDFIVTQENKETMQTTILVAAIRKSDLDNQVSYFEKAGIKLDSVTLDMFALYDFYKNTAPVAQSSLLVVDFSVDAIDILYIQQGILKSVRLVSYGLVTIMNRVDQATTSIMQHRILEGLLQHPAHEEQDVIHHDIAQKIIIDFCKQINLSLSFFKKQIPNFVTPSKIISLGIGTGIPGFLEQVKIHTDISAEIFDIKKNITKSNIVVHKKSKIDAKHSASIMVGLSAAHYGDVNFLSYTLDAAKNSLLYKQLISVAIITCTAFAGIYFYSQYQVRIWDVEYNKSKKELITKLKDQMDVDTKGMKRVTDIVAAAQAKLEQAKKVCFSFSPSNHSFLRYLEELSSKIDRESLGLDLKKLSIHDKEVTLQGKVKDFDVLETFEEELMELKNFTLKSKLPGELAFTVVLQAQDTQDAQ